MLSRSPATSPDHLPSDSASPIDAHARDLTSIRKLIASHKRWDLVFACCGVFRAHDWPAYFTTLFVDMAIDACRD
jgi:hypothetical protein